MLAKNPGTRFFGQNTFLRRFILPLSQQQTGSKLLHFVIAANSVTVACNVISLLVEAINFAKVLVKQFRKF